MTLGVIPNPQFVGLNFDLVDSPIYDRVDSRGFKLYVKLRRFIWRKETGPLGEFFEAGHLAVDGYLSQWATWLGVSKPTLSRILNQLEEAGWIKWAVRSSKGGQPNVLILGRWIPVDDKRLEVYFVDTLVRAADDEQEQDATVSPVKQTVSPQKRTVSSVKPSNRESNREPNNDARSTSPSQPSPSETILPDTPKARVLFAKVRAEHRARNEARKREGHKLRRSPKKFPSLACKRKFLTAAERLDGQFEPAVDRALEKGILSISQIVDFIAKWNTNGGNYGSSTHNRPATGRGAPPAARRSGGNRARKGVWTQEEINALNRQAAIELGELPACGDTADRPACADAADRFVYADTADRPA
jgi:hypothetical protein